MEIRAYSAPFMHWHIKRFFRPKCEIDLQDVYDHYRTYFDFVPVAAPYTTVQEGKRCTSNNIQATSPLLASYLSYLNSEEVLNFLTNISGFVDLQPDWDFEGGGLHLSGEGASLALHTDFTHLDTDLVRRLNLLVYLSPVWEPSWGGGLELWHRKSRKLAKTIYPEFNSAVIFETSLQSLHGHPVPVFGDHLRASLALYYYQFVEGSGSGESVIWHHKDGTPHEGQFDNRSEKWEERSEKEK